MDGNRRWARQRGLPTLEGHRRGYEKLKQVGQWCLDRGIKFLTVYAFSTENWKRSKREVGYLMRLFKRALTKEVEEFDRKGIQLRVIGRHEGLAADLKQAIRRATARTKGNTTGVLNLAINYGGHYEILDAVRQLLERRFPLRRLNPQSFRRFLYAPDEPDPDLIIRTSGEQRLSGFLTWQCAYSELYFTKKHWPEFSERDLDAALADYARRQRRFGGR